MFKWSLLRFSSIHKTIPLPLAKFIIPHPPLTVMLFEKACVLFKAWDQPKMKLIHFVIKCFINTFTLNMLLSKKSLCDTSKVYAVNKQ